MKMKTSFYILLLLSLSLGLLTTSYPYAGIKGGSRWRYQQTKTDVSFPGGPEEESESGYGKGVGIESGSVNKETDYVQPNSGTIEKLGPVYSPGVDESSKDLNYVPEETITHEGTGSRHPPDKIAPIEGKDLGHVPDYINPVEVADSDYSPDKAITDEGTDSGYSPDAEISTGYLTPKETGSDYVPEEKIPYEATGTDHSPDTFKSDQGISTGYQPPKETGSDYVPEEKIPIEGTGTADHSPDTIKPDKGISSDYIPPKDITPKDTGSDYVPEEVVPYGKTGSSYGKDKVIEDLEEEYIPGKEVYNKKLGSGSEGTYEEPIPEHVPGKGDTFAKGYDQPSETFIQKLKKKWNNFSVGTKDVAESFGRAIHSTYEDVHGHFQDLWHKFKIVLSSFGYEIQRGARYVFTVISKSVEEVKAYAIIEKLEQRLEQGNEMVDEFFQKIGQKLTLYAQQHNHENIDEGLFLVSQQSKDKDFMNIFQDSDISGHIEKMVGVGAITQEEADLLSQIKQTNIEGDSGGSYTYPNKNQGSGSYGIEGTIDQIDSSVSYGTEGKVDQVSGLSSYNNQDEKPHHTTKKELESEKVEHHSKGYDQPDQKTIYFPKKG